MWECKVCGHLNPDESEVCEQCGALRDGFRYGDMTDDLVEDEDLGLF